MDKATNTARAHRALCVAYVVLMGLVALLFGSPKVWLFVLGIPAALHLVVSIGADRERNWSRIASLMLGGAMLIGFPIGTAIGLYLIANAKSDWRLERPRYSGSLTDGWPVRAEAEGA